MKIAKENVASEFDTGASVSILNKKTCDLSVNLIPILSKVKSHSGELIDPLAKIVCKVIYKRQLHHHSFIIVDGKKPNLSGRDMLCVIKTNWSNYLCKS